jgi:hypothetical protein
MVTLRNTKGAPLTYTEMDSNLLEFEQANTNLQNNIATGLASKASVNHTQLAATITDLPAVAALQDFSQTTGTRPTSAIQGLDTTIAAINTSLANLTANKVDKVNSVLSGATLVTSPQPTAANNEIVSAAWVLARIAEIGIAGGAVKNTVLPSVTVSGGGSLIVGAILNGSNGTWTGNPTITYTYQWFRSTTGAIGGETTINHTIVSADLGTTLTLRVTASNSVPSTGVAFSAGTIVPPASLVFTANPSFTGTLTVGSTVTTDGGTTSPANPTTVQWYRVIGGAIAGATGLNYTLVSADGGQDLFVRATSTLAGTTVTADSITQRINAVNPWVEGTSFSSTNSIKALALASDQSALYIAENIVVSGGGSITAPAYRAVNTTSTVTAHTMTMATTGFVTGDLVLFVAAFDYWQAVTITWPAGATQLFNDGYYTSDGVRFAAAWLIISGSVPGNYVMSFTDAGDWATPNATFSAIALSGASGVDFSTYQLGSTFRASPIDMPNAVDTQLSGTTGFANDMLVYVATADPGGGDYTGIASFNPATGFTERLDTVADPFSAITIDTKVQASAGATGNITGAQAVFSGAGVTAGYVCALIAVKGVAGGGGAEVSNGIIAKSLRSGGTSWAAKSTVYSGDGVAASTNEGWYTGLACTSDAGTVLIGAASNGYAGPGYGIVYDLVNDEQIQRWVGTFDAPAGTAWPDAIACSSDGLTRLVLVRGTTNQVWTFDGTEVGVVIPISSLTGAPVSLTPTAFGNRLALSADGLKFAVVTSTNLNLYSRSAKQAAWSLAGTITPRASGLASVAMSRDATVLAVSTSAGVDVYQGTFPTLTFQAALSPTGGGYSSLGLGLAIDQGGAMIIASEYTATGATGTTRSEKTSVIRTWKRAP